MLTQGSAPDPTWFDFVLSLGVLVFIIVIVLFIIHQTFILIFAKFSKLRKVFFLLQQVLHHLSRFFRISILAKCIILLKVSKWTPARQEIFLNFWKDV